ncbi:MAG TPA: tetratricopeptide repeat protein [Kiritimatiellia bacterium]|nr:tetratricopeptide repeat protein [Kiritimatiellia bacterium]HPC49227.1 tetratricopeptide repeat protein [Kiritimatiellia bacterium]HPK36643.1 tetratricopeptide repeat protein [Kiritimatiellia bacterium]HPW74681.1 tetratricopeptide repeat protein [Kiritimatiellia bacterium]
MASRKHRFFTTPWQLIRFFLPVVTLLTAVVYAVTLFRHLYPGTPAFLTAMAAGLCQQNDLAHPLFSLIIRPIAQLPYATLPVRLNLFCAACGTLAATLFYLLTARLIFIWAAENPGGSMAALPPGTEGIREDEGDLPNRNRMSFPLPASEMPILPASVQAHNWRSARAAALGGMGAALAFAFCGPFWIAATRLYPFAFDLALFFLLLNLLIAYDQKAHPFFLFASSFLLAACCVESPLFLLLLPVGSGFLLRSLLLNEHATFYRTLAVVLTGLIGFLTGGMLLWRASALCAAVPIPAPRPILNVLTATMLDELARWVPSFGWSYIFMQLLFPCAIALFIFAFSFRKRTPLLFLMQLTLAATLIPSLLNLRMSPWAIARMTSRIPVFSSTIVAFLTGLLIAVWYLMREMFDEQLSEDLDYYEYRDHPLVCRIGRWLCWPLLALACLVPFRSFTDIDPREGAFVDVVTDRIYATLDTCDWIVNSSTLTHHLMLRAFQDGRRLRLIETEESPDGANAKHLGTAIREDPSLTRIQARLLNAADLSPVSFLREWLTQETNAYSRIALFRTPVFWRENGFTPLPNSIFFNGLPQDVSVDLAQLRDRHQAFVEFLQPHLFPATPDSIRLFAKIRAALAGQLACAGNELAVLFAGQKRFEEAAELLAQTEALMPDNLSVLLNRYHLALGHGLRADTLPALQTRLREIPRRYARTHLLTPASVQAQTGTLISPDILEQVRKSYWTKSGLLQQLSHTLSPGQPDPFLAVRDKKRELYQTIAKHLETYEFDIADLQLNLLLDIDDRDRFALVNKARLAIERRDLPEAGLWMDLAKENGVTPAELIWHEAALLILDGKLPEARERLNTALNAAPADIGLWGLLAEILLQLEEYPELEMRVFPVLRSASVKKEHYLMYKVRGYLLRHNGTEHYRAARANFLRALELNPNLNDVREEILRLDDVLEVPAFSEQDACAILRQNPDHAFANYLWGRVRLERGEVDLAEDLFRRSLETERNAPAFAGLGTVLLEKGEHALAEKFLRRALDDAPQRLDAWHALARLLLATGRADEASRALDAVLQAKPDDFSARLTLIRIRMAQRNLREAAEQISGLLEQEAHLPRHILRELKPLSQQLLRDLAN